MRDVNVVFVNYFVKEDILRAIASVFHDSQNSPYSLSVTVVDNSRNEDGIKEALSELFKNVTYVDAGGNVGFGKGSTLGFKANPARYYFALNRDTYIPKETRAIERLIRFMDENPHVGSAGPKLLYPDGTLQYSCFRFDLPSMLIKPFKHLQIERRVPVTKKIVDRHLMRDFDHESTRAVDWVIGAAMITRAEAILEAGWFDDRYFMYLEDCDWCHSLWEKNWPVYYVHDVSIIHAYERQSLRVPGIRGIFTNKLARIHIVSWFKYLWKWLFKHKSYGEFHA